MESLINQLLLLLFGAPDATRLTRTIRGVLASLGNAALNGLTDCASQWFAVYAAGGNAAIDWHLVQRTMLITIFPTALGWVVALAVYLRKIAEENKPEGVIYADAEKPKQYIAPRDLP